MDCTPTVVVSNAICFICWPDEVLDQIDIYLLCQIANS